MSFLAEHPRVRWAAPAAALAVVAGGFLAATQASADPALPPRSPEQLLVDLQESEPTPMSGTLAQSANLGLPELPGSTRHDGPGHSGATEFSALLSGTNTLRLWYGGPERARVALVGTGGESDLIRNGRDVWLWSSSEEKAVHHTLPEDAEWRHDHAPSGPDDLPMTPEDAAEEVLDRLEPTTGVSSDGTATVAGRPAYELVLEPKSSRTLVDSVRIAVDAERKIPLRVQIHSTRSSDPAFEVGFTDVDFTAPEPRIFEFTPPPGTTVTEGRDHGDDSDHRQKSRAEVSEPTVIGSGWDAVAITDAPRSAGSEMPDDESTRQFLDALPEVSGEWGSGRLLEGTVFSAILTEDGRLAVGMVPPETLESALARS